MRKGEKNFDCLACVTVTFNPDLNVLDSQLRALPPDSIKVIVDNASLPLISTKIKSATTSFKNIHIIHCGQNLGLAAAINRGATWLASQDSPPKFILLLDQDSEPQADSIALLLTAFQNLEAEGHKVGCVGPLLVDTATGLNHGFHQSTEYFWKRIYPADNSVAPIQCSNLNGSGTLVPLYLFHDLGGLEDNLFIDHIDTEWSFRVIAHGFSLWGIPNAHFEHTMGQASRRVWLFGWRVWPVRSPSRHHFLYRNTIILLKRPYVPPVWKVWAIVKILLTTIITVLLGPTRRRQIQNMWQGITNGIRHNRSNK